MAGSALPAPSALCKPVAPQPARHLPFAPFGRPTRVRGRNGTARQASLAAESLDPATLSLHATSLAGRALTGTTVQLVFRL